MGAESCDDRLDVPTCQGAHPQLSDRRPAGGFSGASKPTSGQGDHPPEPPNQTKAFRAEPGFPKEEGVLPASGPPARPAHFRPANPPSRGPIPPNEPLTLATCLPQTLLLERPVGRWGLEMGHTQQQKEAGEAEARAALTARMVSRVAARTQQGKSNKPRLGAHGTPVVGRGQHKPELGQEHNTGGKEEASSQEGLTDPSRGQ